MRRVEYWAQLGCPLYKALTRERTLDLAHTKIFSHDGVDDFYSTPPRSTGFSQI
jgi:hypothetical protein